MTEVPHRTHNTQPVCIDANPVLDTVEQIDALLKQKTQVLQSIANILFITTGKKSMPIYFGPDKTNYTYTTPHTYAANKALVFIPHSNSINFIDNIHNAYSKYLSTPIDKEDRKVQSTSIINAFVKSSKSSSIFYNQCVSYIRKQYRGYTVYPGEYDSLLKIQEHIYTSLYTKKIVKASYLNKEIPNMFFRKRNGDIGSLTKSGVNTLLSRPLSVLLKARKLLIEYMHMSDGCLHRDAIDIKLSICNEKIKSLAALYNRILLYTENNKYKDNRVLVNLFIDIFNHYIQSTCTITSEEIFTFSSASKLLPSLFKGVTGSESDLFKNLVHASTSTDRPLANDEFIEEVSGNKIVYYYNKANYYYATPRLGGGTLYSSCMAHASSTSRILFYAAYPNIIKLCTLRDKNSDKLKARCLLWYDKEKNTVYYDRIFSTCKAEKEKLIAHLDSLKYINIHRSNQHETTVLPKNTISNTGTFLIRLSTTSKHSEKELITDTPYFDSVCIRVTKYGTFVVYNGTPIDDDKLPHVYERNSCINHSPMYNNLYKTYNSISTPGNDSLVELSNYYVSSLSIATKLEKVPKKEAVDKLFPYYKFLQNKKENISVPLLDTPTNNIYCDLDTHKVYSKKDLDKLDSKSITYFTQKQVETIFSFDAAIRRLYLHPIPHKNRYLKAPDIFREHASLNQCSLMTFIYNSDDVIRFILSMYDAPNSFVMLDALYAEQLIERKKLKNNKVLNSRYLYNDYISKILEEKTLVDTLKNQNRVHFVHIKNKKPALEIINTRDLTGIPFSEDKKYILNTKTNNIFNSIQIPGLDKIFGTSGITLLDIATFIKNIIKGTKDLSKEVILEILTNNSFLYNISTYLVKRVLIYYIHSFMENSKLRKEIELAICFAVRDNIPLTDDIISKIIPISAEYISSSMCRVGNSYYTCNTASSREILRYLAAEITNICNNE